MEDIGSKSIGGMSGGLAGSHRKNNDGGSFEIW